VGTGERWIGRGEGWGKHLLGQTHYAMQEERLTLMVSSMLDTATIGKVGCCSITDVSSVPNDSVNINLPLTMDPSPSHIPSRRPVSLSQTKKCPSSLPEHTLSERRPRKLPDRQ